MSGALTVLVKGVSVFVRSLTVLVKGVSVFGCTLTVLVKGVRETLSVCLFTYRLG